MAIDSSGLTIKRYEDILSELEAALRSYFGNSIDLSENALLGILNIIYANSQAEQWEMAQAVYNAFNIESAVGKQLDDLVALVGLRRLDEAESTGILELGGSEGTLVTSEIEFKTNDTDKSVFLDDDVSITSAKCFKAHTSVTAVVGSFLYTIDVNGTTYSYLANGSETIDDIMTLLTIEINSDSVAQWSASFTPANGYMEILAITTTFPLSIQVSANQQFNTIFSSGQASLNEVGDVKVFANSVTVIVDTVVGLDQVNNSAEFTEGRLEETDEELRARHRVSTSIIGSASPDAIEAAMRALDGVTYAEVFENVTMLIDERGLPPKSFEVVIEGGSETDISQTLYNVKPAGIETFGNTRGTAVDQDDNVQGVFYTRPVDRPVFVSVTYTLYDEEVFPPNGVDLIKQSVVSHIETLRIDEDVIAQRIYGAIYSNVAGILNLDIKLGYTAGTITETTLPIDTKERASTELGNVFVTLGS